MTGAQEAPNLRAARAQEVFAALPRIVEDMTARPDGETSLAFLSGLAGSSTPEEAMTFAAYALRRRHAVWWGHECLRQADGQLDDGDRALLALAADWVGRQDEDSRYAALDAAMAAPAKTPGVWIALGAGWSSGSMGPRDQPPVPVAPFLTARAVNAGVLSALARMPREERGRMLGLFADMARILAEGG